MIPNAITSPDRPLNPAWIAAPYEADPLTLSPVLRPPLRGEELRIAIALEILGWKPAKIGPDASGKDAGEILTPDGKLFKDFEYPRRGKISLAYHAPYFGGLGGFDMAMSLVRQVGLKTPACDLPTDPETLAWMCLELHRAKAK